MKTLLSFLLALCLMVVGAALLWYLSEWVFTQNARLIQAWFGWPALSFSGRLLQLLLLAAEVCMAVLLIAAALIRYRKPRVFISFKHVHEEKAEALAAQLAQAGLKVLRLPFGQYSHDEIVDYVRQALRKADALVAVPDAENVSFVDAELMAASVRRIPIALMQYQERQFQPTTLLRGYPVFDYNCLTTKDFEPLKRYLWFSARHPREYLRMAGRIFKVFFDSVNWMVFGILIAVYALMEGAKQLLNRLTDWLFDVTLFGADADTAIFYNTVFMLLLIGYAGYLIYAQLRTLHIARQMTSTGTDSYEAFSEAFSILKSDRKILDCIRRNNFIPRGSTVPGWKT